jgi:lipoprotein signal peptidase
MRLRKTGKLLLVQGLIIGIVAIWVGLDQALKYWTIANVPFGTVHPYESFPAFMSFAHVRNTGAAWSLFSSATPLLVVVRVVVGALILIWLLRKPRSKLESVAFSFIVGGAWGNAIDGIQYGYVVDMLQNHWLTAAYRILQPNQIFPIFNLADMGVVGGVLLLITASFFPAKAVPSPVLEPIEPTSPEIPVSPSPEIPVSPSLEFEIRSLDLSQEAPALLELQRSAYKIEADLIGFQGIPGLHETLEELQATREIFYGAYQNQVLIGAVSYRFRDTILDIHRLVVSPRYFRQGVARGLLEYLCKTHVDVEKIVVQTGSQNTPALALYQSLGFVLQDEIALTMGVKVTRLEWLNSHFVLPLESVQNES